MHNIPEPEADGFRFFILKPNLEQRAKRWLHVQSYDLRGRDVQVDGLEHRRATETVDAA